MEDSTKKLETTDENLTQRLAGMEELLRQQLEENKKIAKHRRVLSLLMLCLVVVFALGLFALNNTLTQATQDLPQLIDTTNESVQQLKVTLEDISSLDFKSMNEAIVEMDQGLAAIDFEALNSAILDLKKATEGLARLASIF